MGINFSRVGRALAATAVIASSVLLGLPSNASAGLGTGSISGTVRDDANATLKGICVQAREGAPYGSEEDSVQTGTDGTYLLTGLPAGDIYLYFSDCNSPATYVSAWYGGSYNGENATPIPLGAGATLDEKDVSLKPGRTVSGSVTNGNGDPVGNVEVSVESVEHDGAHGWGRTEANGEYTTSPVLPGDYRVRFKPDDVTGPYLDQWYDGSNSRDGATAIEVTASGNSDGVNAVLRPAGQIRGTVTAGDTPLPKPLKDICVQASTDDLTGGMERTDETGTYSIKLAQGGRYKVQFIDCGPDDDEDGPETGNGARPVGYYQAKWWGGGSEPETASYIEVGVGQIVSGKDAELSQAGGTGTVSGRVTNVRGQGLRACIAVYAPTEAVFFVPTEDDGSYSAGGIPTGTWTIGFVGCPDGSDDDDPIGYISDAGDTGVAFPAQWYGSVPLALGGDSDAPDPIAQGAQFVTIHPGDAVNATVCFGCESVKVAPPEIGDGHIVVTFESTGLFDHDRHTSDTGAGNAANRAAARPMIDYNVACGSDTGRATTATIRGDSAPGAFPVKVSGFTPGAPYVCSARILSNGVEVADSTAFEVTVGKAAPAPPTDDDPATAATPDPPGAGSGGAPPSNTDPVAHSPSGPSPAKLAYTGSGTTVQLVLGALMILLGSGLVLTTKRIGSSHPRRRATS